MKYPEQTDNYDIEIINENFIELELGAVILGQDLQDEVNRAKAAEKSNADSISAEAERAAAAENQLAADIQSEAERAASKETMLENSFAAEAQSIRQLVDTAYGNANDYTDTKIADLIGGAPSTLDTLGEIAQAMRDNESVVDALDEAVGKKASASELDSHIKDRANPHLVTKEQVGLGNVGNYKAVSTSASQGLTDAEKANARSNIGAGTSSFSGNYNDLANKPAIPSIPASLPANGGHASTADAATKATQDGDGRIIADTYYHIHGNYGFNNASDHTKYVHLFTIDPFFAYVTDQYVFCVASRTDGVSTICVSVSSDNNKYVNCNITYYGNELGNKIRGYEYKKNNEGKTTVEIYFIMTGWDDARFYPLLYHSRTTSATWDVRDFSALPTDATREVLPRYLEWGGNAATANAAIQAGNADTVDGKHASDLQNYNNLTNRPSIPAAVAVKGSAEASYRTGNVNITPANIGLGNVNNTADANKSVNYANSAGYANSVGSVAYGNVTGRPTFSLSGSTLNINF